MGVGEIRRQLTPFVEWFSTQKMYKFYSSSILFVWDAASPKGSPKVLVKLVDFAHTFPNAETDSTLDQNFLSALGVLVNLWEDVASFGREIFENQRLKVSPLWPCWPRLTAPQDAAWSKDALLRHGARAVPHPFLAHCSPPPDRASYSSGDGRTPLKFQNPQEWVIDKSLGINDGWLY